MDLTKRIGDSTAGATKYCEGGRRREFLHALTSERSGHGPRSPAEQARPAEFRDYALRRQPITESRWHLFPAIFTVIIAVVTTVALRIW
jgi:hypothetical protein